jgi:hypothetical protein
MYPAVQLRSFYSIDFSDSIRILLEQIDLVAIHSIQHAIQHKKYDNICLIKDKLYINFVNQLISVVGTKFGENCYFVTRDSSHDTTYHIPYYFSQEKMIEAIQLIAHMHQNWAVTK